jgi:hypothetical protein
MRELSDTLKKAQQAAFVDAIYKIVLTKGASSYTYEKDRILPSKHDEEMYSHLATVILDNSDGEFDDKDLKGYDAVISYGVIMSAGEEYSETDPLSVTDQQFDSSPDKLTCELILEGIPNLMARDEASANYIPDVDNTDSVKELVNSIVMAYLDCFSHCKAFEIVWDDGYDTLADTYAPKDSFRIYIGGTRLAALRKLLDYTANVARFSDGKVHILKPVMTGTTYDYEYNLETGHKFFSKAYRNTLVFPNRVIVQSQTDDDPFYQGEAQIDGYDHLLDTVKKTQFFQTRLESDDQADNIAEALIAKAEMGSKRGQAEVPMNIGAEVFDYVKVTDQREGDTRTGNLGYIHRRFGQDKWTMTFGFGNWLEMLRYQAILNGLQTYTDAGNYFATLRVGTLYAYLDYIQDGPDVYIRQRSLKLDATGVYLEENIVYTIRLPGEAQHKLTKSDTAPSDPDEGDFWIDTNSIPNPVMIWNGDSWDELTAEEIAKYNRATIFRELKDVALTADGLVVLDEVQEGTYGLVLYTNIQAGSILLSKTVKDGKWYEETGVVLDATYGIALYGGEGINAFRTFATKEDYEAGTPVQVYIGTDGNLYAGAGAVWLSSEGISVKGEFITFYDLNGIKRGLVYGSAAGAMVVAGEQNVILDPNSTYDIIALIGQTDCFRPNMDGYGKVGEIGYQFYGGYFKSRLKIPVGTDLYD